MYELREVEVPATPKIKCKNIAFCSLQRYMTSILMTQMQLLLKHSSWLQMTRLTTNVYVTPS